MSAGHDIRVARAERIRQLLAIEEPPIERVYRGDRGRINPQLPAGGPYATFWISGESEKSKTLGNVMVWHRYGVRIYWPRAIEDEPIERQDEDMEDAMRNVQAAFRGDSTLGGKANDLEITLADIGWVGDDGNGYPTHHILEFDLEVEDLEAEAIVA